MTIQVNDMFDLLYNYFIQNRSLSLPGIGTFDLFRISAQTDFANKKILPPTFTISFDRMNDTPDKGMFQYISGRRQISEWEAMKLVNDFSQDLKLKLRSGEIVEWVGIGVLKPDEKGEFLFEPDRLKYDFNPNVEAQRVIRIDEDHRMLVGDHEMSKTEMEHYLHDEARMRKRARWWLYALIIALVAIILIIIQLIRHDTFTGGRARHITPDTKPGTYESSS